jgi:hypothetical protein
MAQPDAERLALWLRRWREELALAEARGLPEPLPSDIPTPPRSSQVQPFDSPDLVHGEIRLLDPWLVRDVRRPLFIAVLKEWLDGLWLVAPFGRFPSPATPGEWQTGYPQDELAVLCLWNAHTVPLEVVRQSWWINNLESSELEDAWTVFRHVATGELLPAAVMPNVGPPLYHPADPRHDYLAEEVAGLRPLARLAEEYVDRLETKPSVSPSPGEMGVSDFSVISPLGRRLPVGSRGGTGGGVILKLRVSSLEVRVTFRQDARGEAVFARVTRLNDSELSHRLDGGVVMAGGKAVGKFARGRAEFRAAALTVQIALRDRQGRPLSVEIEAAP